MASQFLVVFKDYLIEILPYLALGFLLSGIIYELVPTKWVEQHLGGKGIKAILYTTLIGTVLPVCCWGSLPIAVSLQQKGVRLGPVLAFLVATPATSVSALLVCYAFLGIKFTVFIFFAVILMGLLIGIIGNLIKFEPKPSTYKDIIKDPICGMNIAKEKAIKIEYKGTAYYFCSQHCQEAFETNPGKNSGKQKVKAVLNYSFVYLPKEIGLEILLGLILAALVATIVPIGKFVGDHLSGAFGYLFSLGFGLLIYICATASVPLVDAFISQGMNIGAGMTLLLIGPVTSYGTILVLRKEFGSKILLIFLAAVSLMGLILGYIFSLIY